MEPPDFAQARAYTCHRLANELSPALTYHSLAHTRDDVVPAVERLALLSNVGDDDLLLLRTAAWFHDLGFVEQANDHELISMQIAKETLPRFGYTAVQIEQIVGMIMATRMPQTPRTLLETLIADADLDSLGRTDFLMTSLDLRAERAALGTALSPAAWFAQQQRFLRQHRYFTQAAHCLREHQKQRNIALLTALLAAHEKLPSGAAIYAL